MKCKLTLPEKLKDLRVEHVLALNSLQMPQEYPVLPSAHMKPMKQGR